jgi:hypothetical protein
MTTFEPFWASLVRDLKPGTIVGNWTTLKGFLGDKMMIVNIGQDSIEVNAPGAMTNQIVPKSDFERVWRVWQAYKAQTVARHDLRDVTRFSKYIISILHWFEEAR